ARAGRSHRVGVRTGGWHPRSPGQAARVDDDAPARRLFSKRRTTTGSARIPRRTSTTYTPLATPRSSRGSSVVHGPPTEGRVVALRDASAPPPAWAGGHNG